jgi:SAM-dependent methyltransferase
MPTMRQNDVFAFEEWRRLGAPAKLGLAWKGVRELLDGLRQRGIGGRILATALMPVGLGYALGTVLRDTFVYRAGGPVRRPVERRVYLRHRYGGTQRLVNWREQWIVAALLRQAETPGRVMDVPSGYGRFTPALEASAAEGVVCVDIDHERLVALRCATPEGREPGVVRADLRGALPFASRSFDLVFNLRYLHHVYTREEQEQAVAELVRVSRRYVLLSYYRRSNLHAVQREVQTATRPNRRGRPAMIAPSEFDRLLREVGCRRIADRALLPGFHAQRLVLLERIDDAGDGAARVRRHQHLLSPAA